MPKRHIALSTLRFLAQRDRGNNIDDVGPTVKLQLFNTSPAATIIWLSIFCDNINRPRLFSAELLVRRR